MIIIILNKLFGVGYFIHLAAAGVQTNKCLGLSGL